jgi:hypothetical protein
MEEALINAGATLLYGGGGIVIVAYFCFLAFKMLCERNKESIKQICDTNETNMSRVCDSFDRALDRRDSDIEQLVKEVRR